MVCEPGIKRVSRARSKNDEFLLHTLTTATAGGIALAQVSIECFYLYTLRSKCEVGTKSIAIISEKSIENVIRAAHVVTPIM